MAFEKIVPAWSAAGTEPPDSLKVSGFTAGYKPPAAYFNWFWNGVSEALSELQSMTPDDIGAAVADTHKIKSYTALTQIGLSDGATLSEVANALPAGSVLRMYVLTSTNTDLAPSATNGWFEAYKPLTNHVFFQYITTSRKPYYAVVLNVGTDSETTGNWDGIVLGDDLPSELTDLSGTLPVSMGGTGGTTADSAVKNLLGKTLINDSSVVDANTLVSTGIHKVYVTDETVATTYNYPYVYGNLVVISNMEDTDYAYVVQLFITTGGHMYSRASSNNGSSWSDWGKFYSTRNKPALTKLGTIGTSWTEDEETGVKYQTVSISGITADNTAKVDHDTASIDGTSDGYATFVEEENQFLDFITNGYAETVEGGITFYIFGDPNTVSIPIVVEVV